MANASPIGSNLTVQFEHLLNDLFRRGKSNQSIRFAEDLTAPCNDQAVCYFEVPKRKNNAFCAFQEDPLGLKVIPVYRRVENHAGVIDASKAKRVMCGRLR